jgi:hypothetical protein
MDDIVLVHVQHRGDQLAEHLGGWKKKSINEVRNRAPTLLFLDTDVPPRLEIVAQRSALAVLHHDVVVSRVREVVDPFDDVLVRRRTQSTHRPHFAIDSRLADSTFVDLTIKQVKRTRMGKL